MYNRFSLLLQILHLAILPAILLVSCEQPTTDQEQQQPDEKAAPIGTIVYRIEVLSDHENSASTFQRTVYFDGKRSAVTEQTNDHGFPGMTTVFASGRDSVETYIKALPYVTFQVKRERSISDEMGVPVVQKGAFTKSILGYRCHQLILETEQFRYSVWYTTDVTVHDPTQAVVQDADVPGLILEMDKTLKGRNDWHTLVVVTAFEPHSKSSGMLEIPKEAIEVADVNEALVQNRLLFEQAMQREKQLNWDDRQQFLGTWLGREKGQMIRLKIERYGEAYTYTEGKSPGTTRGIAGFYGNRLLLEQGAAWRTYFLDNVGNLRSDQDEDLVLKKH
jgi:hypothetical protein